MNALAIIISTVNILLLTASFGGLFLDVPAAKNLSNKERVQTALLQSVSERDTEILDVKKKKADLEREIPLIPVKIDEAKQTFALHEKELSVIRAEREKASSTLGNLQKKNTEKEKEIQRLLQRSFPKGKKGATVFSATFSAPKDDDLKIQEVSVRDSLRLSSGETVRNENLESGFAVSNALPCMELWDSEKRLAEADQDDDGTFSFRFSDNSPIVVSKGSSKTFFIKADISSSAKTGERHRILLLGADTTPVSSPDIIEKNAPIFVIGDTPSPTIALYELAKTEGKAKENLVVRWSLLNVARDAKVAIVFASADKQQMVIAKNLSAFANRANIKIPSLAAGSYTVAVVAYEGENFCIDCKGENAPTILATGKGDGQFRIVGAE